MNLSPEHLTFLEKTHSASMITLRRDGSAQAVRVGIALVDGKIWSSGTRARIRTRHLRRDPRSTLFVFDSGFNFLTLESTVTILEGPDVPEQSLRLFQIMQAGSQPAPAPGSVMWFGQEMTPTDFKAAMVAGQRLIYEFHVHRAYGPFMG